MALIRNPIRPGTFLRVEEHDRDDFIVENELSQNRQFFHMDRTNQLTQGGFNMSPFTRQDGYRDVTIERPVIVGRMERANTPNQPGKYGGEFYD